jgi:hypothetical protein
MGVSKLHAPNGDVFEFERDLIDVSMARRPDPSWRYVDAQGHVHNWYVNGKPAESYSPSASYETPTLTWVKTGEEWYEDDDEPHDIGHLQCSLCGEPVQPRYCSDTTKQYIHGLAHYRINGEHVSQEEFERRAKAAIQ